MLDIIQTYQNERSDYNIRRVTQVRTRQPPDFTMGDSEGPDFDTRVEPNRQPNRQETSESTFCR